jgi:hypothetical protein
MGTKVAADYQTKAKKTRRNFILTNAGAMHSVIAEPLKKTTSQYNIVCNYIFN